jgi:signal transduction histidine kinase
MGRHYSEVLPSEVATQLSAALVQVRATGEVAQIDYALTYDDGQLRWFSANISPILGRQPGPMTFVVAARDITDHKRAEAVEREQRVMAEALREVALALNSTLQLDEIWDHILANVARVAPSDAAAIILVDGESGYVVRARGYAERKLDDLLLTYAIPIHLFGHLQYMIDTHQPCLIPDTWTFAQWLLDDHSSYPNWLVDRLGHFARSYLGAPILLEGEVIGFINLESEQPNYFTPTNAANLQVFADYAASAIGNARLYAQAQEIAALHERQRLARDLHDAVSQMLFSAKIIVEMLPKLRERNPDSVWAYLPELHKLVQGAMGEMRTLLLELRPSSLTDVDLDVLLRHLADASGGRTAATVSLSIEGEAQLPKPVQIARYRIAQEALNNAVKHSRAANIAVMLHQTATRVELSVRDDGIGFDRTQLRPEQLGLSIMHERAQEIGGELTLQSTPGAGAEVRIRWLSPAIRG